MGHFSFFRLIRDPGTAALRLADGDEQPPGALERTSSCTATRTGVAGLGTARRGRRGVAHRGSATSGPNLAADRPGPQHRGRPLRAVAADPSAACGRGRIRHADRLPDVARIVASDATGLSGIAVALVLPYALFRWASGREAAIGLGIILVWLGVTHVADPTTVGEVVAAYGFFLFSAALGASIRFHATTRMRDIEQAELRQRHELARDLHDTIGHHMSGIVIEAQAGRAVAAPTPIVCSPCSNDRARSDPGAGGDAHNRRCPARGNRAGPRPAAGLPDIERLTDTDQAPAIEVHLSDLPDGMPATVGVAVLSNGVVELRRRQQRESLSSRLASCAVRVRSHRQQLDQRPALRSMARFFRCGNRRCA